MQVAVSGAGTKQQASCPASWVCDLRELNMRSHGAMNRVYRLVWSAVHHLWIAVSELCSGAGRAASSSPQTTVLLVASAIAAGAFAAPTGGQVVSGDATISQTGNTGQSTTTINQTSQLAKLHWQSFNVGSGETVNFVQPSSTSLAVNRILDTQGSQIMGRLNANGQVWLINPNGVLFGKGAQINVGGLVASTLDVQGAGSTTPVFSGNSSASVENQGSLQSAHGGYVALIAHKVNNQGSIHTPGGSAVLGAGSTVRLQMTGNRLLAVEVQQNQLDALAANAGLIQADGGQVLMSAGARDSLLASAVNNTGIVQARAIGTQAGKIMLLGGMAAGTSHVSGTLDAAAPNGGDGGFIETSAAKVNVSEQAVVTTLAPQGRTGNWLIDPKDYEVNYSNVDAIKNALVTNNLTIHTERTGTNTPTDIYGSGVDSLGNIYINAPIVVTTNNQLTLSAYKDIYINEPVTLSTRSGGAAPKLILKYGQGSGNGTIGVTKSDYYINAPVTLPAGVGNFQTQIGTGGTLDQFFVITGLGSAGDLSGTTLQGINGNLGGLYALGADIDASSTVGWNNSGLGNKGWNNIGNASTAFTGTFAGLGHKINGLYLQRPGTSQSGMFGIVGFDGKIRDLGLTNLTIENYKTAGSYTGGLVGKNSGTIKNSYVSGSVLGTKSATALGGNALGGFVGYNNGTIIDSYSTASVTANGGGSRNLNTGSFVGENVGTIKTSYAAGLMSNTSTKDFYGFNPGNLNQVYFDYTAAGASTYTPAPAIARSVTDVTGLSATDARNGAKYVGFAFSSADSIASPFGPWFMPLGVARPTLRWSLARATVDISITGISKTYDGNNSVSSGFNSNGVLNGVSAGDTVSVSFSAVFSSPNAGSGIPITFTPTYGGTDLSKYRIVPIYSSAVTGTISPKDVTITTSAWNSTYDGVSSYNTLAAGMLFSSTALVGIDSISTVTQTPTGVNANSVANAGSLSVTPSNAVMANGLASNYNFIYSSGTYTVGKAALTVTGNSLRTTYNGANQTMSGFAVSGLQGRDTEADLTSITASGATGKNAGGYVNTISAGTETNYTLGTVNGILNIAKADATVTANSATLSYNGADQTVGGFTASGLVGGDTSAVLIGVSASLTKKNAGTYTTSASGSDSNYNLRFVEGSLVIDKAALTVTGNSLRTTYNGANQTVSGFTVSGLQGGDTEGDLTSISAGGARGKNAGSYANAVTAGTETNYTVRTVNGSLDIAKADATVTANSATLIYNGADQTVSGFTATGLAGGETSAVLTGVSASLTKKNAGTYTTSASGSDSNYNLSFVDGSLVIDKAHLTVSANNSSKTYGDLNPALSTTLSGFVIGEDLGSSDVTGTGLASTSADQRTGAGAAIINASVGSLAANNYDFTTFTNGTLTNTKRPVTFHANDLSKTYGDANPTLSYTVDADRVGSSRGLVNGDALAGNLSTTATRTSAVGEYLIDASALANPLANPNYLVTANNGKLTVETVISINSPQPESPSTAPVLNTPDVGMLKYFQPFTNNLSQEGKRPQCSAISVEFATPSLTEPGSTGFAKPCVIVLPAQKTGALELDLTQTLASYKVLSK
jgi:filamentous hemagglutinin family protein